jgi:hypothetical protein
MHLEAVRKDSEAAVTGAGVQGSGKGPARGRNGGALKKLNKRYHLRAFLIIPLCPRGAVNEDL